MTKVRERLGSYDTIRDNLFDEYEVRTKNYRKLFYRLCKDEEIPREVCDFYQSRITKLNIGDIHYDDLLARADKHYQKLANKLTELLENTSMCEQTRKSH